MNDLLLITSLFLIFFMAQQSEIFDVVVTETSKTHITIVWEEGSLNVPKAEWGKGKFRHWPKEVVKGQLLKATFLVGRLKSVPGCQERTDEAIKDYRQGTEDRYPVNSLMPEDCSRPTSKFILDLLEKMNKEQ